MTTSISDLRQDYSLNGLDRQDVLDNPIAQFEVWFKAALEAAVIEPNAMTLSTVQANGRPRSRVVLLKELNETGFIFYTNYRSQKADDMAAHSFAALTFWWGELERQVRIEGHIEKVSEAESDAYFAVRPRGSQIGAWVSDQSQVIKDREELLQKQKELETRFENQIIPRPVYWGGYRLVPDVIEFWQGRPSRLHDRLRYRLEAENWIIERLSP